MIKNRVKYNIDAFQFVIPSYFPFYLIFASKYFVKTIIDPSAVQMSSNITLLVGYFVI